MNVFTDRHQQVSRDLAEIEQQFLDGEIDETAYASLKQTYRSELEQLDADEEVNPAEPRSRTRLAAGAAILALTIVIITFAASRAAINRDGGFITGSGAETEGPVDLDEISNEQMVAVIEANADLPQVNAMRLALAERYFEDQQYSEAFGWFEEVLQSNPTDYEASEALARTAWMVHASGESEVAIGTLERALLLNYENVEAQLFRGLIYLQTGRAAEAIADLEAAAARDNLTPNILEVITTALDQAREKANQ